jgi:hypothetical protein
MTDMKMTVQFDEYDGEIKINVISFIDSLDEESKHLLLSDGGWLNLITPHIIKEMKTAVSSRNYNGTYYELREALLTGEAVEKMVKLFISSLLREMQYKELWENYYRDRYRASDRAFRQAFTDAYGNVDQRYFEISHRAEEGIQMPSYMNLPSVDEKVDALMREMFEKEDEE